MPRCSFLLFAKIVVSLAIGRFPALLVAALIVKTMRVKMLCWLVIGVVICAAMVIFRASLLRGSLARSCDSARV